MSSAPVVPIKVTPNLEVAVARYVSGCRRDGDCLIRDVKGYGWISLSKTTRYLAHRAVYAVQNGPLTPAEVVRHTCDRPQCVERTHLLRGSIAQNARDMWERGRQAARVGVTGEANPAAVLTAALVVTLRREVRAGASIRGTARKYGLGYPVVRAAVVGESWRHVSEPVMPRQRPFRPSKYRTPDAVADEARSLVDSGMSLAEVGEQLGLNRVTVHHIVWRGKSAS